MGTDFIDIILLGIVVSVTVVVFVFIIRSGKEKNWYTEREKKMRKKIKRAYQ